MAAIATAQAGTWFTPATWVGGVIPGVGDTVTINHAVTIDQNVVVGSSPPTGGTAALLGNAAVTVAAAVLVEFRGDCIMGDATLTLEAGVILEFNPGAGVSYRIRGGNGFNQFNAKIVANGTAQAPVIIRKKAGALGSVGAVTGGFEPVNILQATWLELRNLDAGWDYVTTGSGSEAEFFWIDGVMDGCNPLGIPVGLQPASKFTLRRVKFTNGLGAQDVTANTSGAKTTGTRIIDKCSMRKGLFATGQDILLTECRLAAIQNAAAWDPASKDNLILATTSDHMFSTGATIQRLYMAVDVADNGHWLVLDGGINQTVDQVIMETPNAWGNGDGISLPSPAAPRTYTIKRCYMLPNGNGTAGGRLVSGLGNANVTFSVEHCTAVSNTLGGVGLGETYVGHAGMASSVKSSVYWAPGANGGFFLIREPGSAVQNIAAAASVDFNGLWNMGAGTDGNGVNAATAPNFFSVVGQHQLNGFTLAADPFRDRSRRLATFDLLQGGPGTYASARDRFFDLTLNYDVATLIDYVIEGYQVTDPLLRDAGHDGVTVGASIFFDPPPPPGGSMPQVTVRRTDGASEHAPITALIQQLNALLAKLDADFASLNGAVAGANLDTDYTATLKINTSN